MSEKREDDISFWLQMHINQAEQELISEFVKSIEKRIEGIEYNGFDPLNEFKNLKSEYEEKLK